MVSHTPRSAGLTAADVMTSGEVAELLRIPRSTVEDLARRGKLRSQKIGRHRRYLRRDIEQMLGGGAS